MLKDRDRRLYPVPSLEYTRIRHGKAVYPDRTRVMRYTRIRHEKAVYPDKTINEIKDKLKV